MPQHRLHVDEARDGLAGQRAVQAHGCGDAAHRVEPEDHEGLLERGDAAPLSIERGIGHPQHARANGDFRADYGGEVARGDLRIEERGDEAESRLGAGSEQPHGRCGLQDRLAAHRGS